MQSNGRFLGYFHQVIDHFTFDFSFQSLEGGWFNSPDPRLHIKVALSKILNLKLEKAPLKCHKMEEGNILWLLLPQINPISTEYTTFYFHSQYGCMIWSKSCDCVLIHDDFG